MSVNDPTIVSVLVRRPVRFADLSAGIATATRLLARLGAPEVLAAAW